MDVAPRLSFGHIMHARHIPKRNAFRYGIYQLVLPLSMLEHMPLAYNRRALLSFFDKDHGHCDGSSPVTWARDILSNYGLGDLNGEIILVCMPRVLGYVFNPVSFWFCYDQAQHLRAVLCEVHNTFGERHTYLCTRADTGVITPDDVLYGEKLFHVSPMLEREGHYQFRFELNPLHLHVWIDYYNAAQQKQLTTALSGKLNLMTAQTLRQAFWHYPLMTGKAIFLIHWQALKLLTKGIKYVTKPAQLASFISAARESRKR